MEQQGRVWILTLRAYPGVQGDGVYVYDDYAAAYADWEWAQARIPQKVSIDQDGVVVTRIDRTYASLREAALNSGPRALVLSTNGAEAGDG